MIHIRTINKKLTFMIFLLNMVTNYSYTTIVHKSEIPMKFSTTDLNQHSTIFVHGTLFGLSWLVRLFDCPLGLTPAAYQPNRFVLGRIPYILHQASPTMFPLHKSYLWGWHGELSFPARMSASHKLYHALKRIEGPKTVIGQSHGCNVILNLAKIAHKHKDSNFFIDRLILLTGPVQEVNAHLVNSPIFKKVFSLYSSTDLLQILDPQGLYKETKKLKTPTKLFSEKTFKPAPNLVQAEIVILEKGPSHLDFIKEKFIKHLPDIIELLDKETTNSTDYQTFHYKINIPLIGKPHFVCERKNK